jgi:beta-mannosidase
MPRQTLSLNDASWQFGQVGQRPFAIPEIYDLPAVKEWLPATVPGHIRTDLLALGRISDPFFGEGYQGSRWVEDVDWWVRRTLTLEPLSPGERAFLIFEGIDYRSAIVVNGQELARHEGMFSRHRVEITAALQTGQPAEIAVRLWGSGALPRRRLSWGQQLWQTIAAPLYGSWVGIYPDRSATLKCQMSFGWDFAPPIRTMGVWDEVSLVITGPVCFAEAAALGQPLTLGEATSAGQSARLELPLTLDAGRQQPVQVTARLIPANFDGPSPGPLYFSLNLPAGRTTHRLAAQLSQIALWQPWDRGQPHLYDLQLTVSTPQGRPLDQVKLRTGFRTIELDRWQFSLNGRPEFIRGLNWVPADSFPGRLRPKDYGRLLGQVRQTGANLLRVWGGGLREKRAFYEQCDEMGLLVWQEFPFACMFLGSYPRDESYLSLVEAECGAIVRQLRHHPSLITWCGGNEFSPRRNRPLLQTLTRLVVREDGTRPFIPVSPGFGQGKDAHNWRVWHGLAPFQAYQAETARFLSEFGLQALPHPATLAAALPDPATGWETHHADRTKLQRYTSLFEKPEPGDDGQLLVNNLHPSTIHQSQLAQATGLQTAIEHMRRRKGQAGGVCLWQFNEPWPAISWAIVDYFGRPKLAYERLKDWYNPVLISLNFPAGKRWQAGQIFQAEIWAINDSLESFAGCELQINLDGKPVHLQTLDLWPESARRTGQLSHHLAEPPQALELTLYYQDILLAQNRYELAWSDQAASPIFHRLRRWLADWVLR